jgi:predicted phosphoribosyltransferase
MWTFSDRADAGRRLADEVARLRLERPAIVLGLPRGGVPVAAIVADRLGVPLDVLIVRKVGAPSNPEFAIGAIASGGIVVRDPGSIALLAPDPGAFERQVRLEQAELERRARTYRRGRPPPGLQGCDIVLVDDGLATGSTMLAAIRSARAAGAARVIVAAPVASVEAAALTRAEADDAVFVLVPPDLRSVGEWYEEFGQVDDGTVVQLLQRHATEGAAASDMACSGP